MILTAGGSLLAVMPSLAGCRVRSSLRPLHHHLPSLLRIQAIFDGLAHQDVTAQRMRMRLTCQEYVSIVAARYHFEGAPNARRYLIRPSHVRKYVGGYPSTAALLPNVYANHRTVRAFGLLSTVRAPVRQRSAAGGSAD